MIKYPSIEQFRNVIRQVRTDHDKIVTEQGESFAHTYPYPTIEFVGTVKLHGTNAAIVQTEFGLTYQSRERELSMKQDNSGFMAKMIQLNLQSLFYEVQYKDYCAIFGEWCGSGIQKGVGISNLPKMFVIFGAQVDGEWIDYNKSFPDIGVYNIKDFQKFTISINFERPEEAQNILASITESVELECPVAKQFGVIGIGEGVVWESIDHKYRFKVKGEKHSSSKVKTLATVDLDAINSNNEFIEAVLTSSRLEQGISWLKENNRPVDQTATGDYLGWVIRDVLKEESELMQLSNIDAKKVGNLINRKAREWFFNYLNSNL